MERTVTTKNEYRIQAKELLRRLGLGSDLTLGVCGLEVGEVHMQVQDDMLVILVTRIESQDPPLPETLFEELRSKVKRELATVRDPLVVECLEAALEHLANADMAYYASTK